MDRVTALVLAGGRGVDFGPLSEHRPKAAFPVAGYYRIIDFALSNLSFSGLRQVGIIIQFLPASLMEHVGSGRPWDFDMADRTLRFMTPFVGVRETRWFRGTGDAIAKNINLTDMHDLRDVLILSGDHAYGMDYRELIDYHRQTDADITMGSVEIPLEKQNPRFGNLVIDENGRVTSFLEKPGKPLSPQVSTGIYCFKGEVLRELLASARPGGDSEEISLSGDLLQPHVPNLNVRAWTMKEPWYYLGDLCEYYNFHMDLAAGRVDLFRNWKVMTNFADRNLGSRMPAYYDEGAVVSDSIISPGCRIEGEVHNSVLSPGVHVAKGAVVRNSILFHDVRLGRDVTVQHAILDKDVVVEDGLTIGKSETECDSPIPRADLAVIGKASTLRPEGSTYGVGPA